MSRGSVKNMAKEPKATYEDLLRSGDDERKEIIDGVIVEKAGPSAVHGVAQLATGSVLHRRYARDAGGRWPGGWWLMTEVDVEYGPHDVFCHDIVGWRRERCPVVPTGRPVPLRPDWVCEILSPSNQRNDRVEKFRVLQLVGVPHYWLMDPDTQILTVHRLEATGYVVALTASAGETVRAEPFADVELPVGVLFGEPDEE